MEIWFRALFDLDDIEFTEFGCGGELVEAMQEGRFRSELLILEMTQPDISGLRLLQFMREEEMQTDVILMSDLPELAVYGYRYHVFDFLVKPVRLREAEQIANRYYAESRTDDQNCLTVKVYGNPHRIRLSRVIFFESAGRKITAVMEQEEFEFYMKMDALAERIAACDFLRCHQSYLVNRKYILGYSSGELLLYGKKRLPISRRYAAAVRETLAGGNGDEW